MKKLAILFLGATLLFATSNNEINQKLNLILQKMQQLEKKVDSKDNEINNLKKELKEQKKAIKAQKVQTKKEFMINDCSKIKVSNLHYNYVDGFIPYMEVDYTLTNTYPFSISKLSGKLYIKDKDGTTMMTDFINKDVNLNKGASITIHHRHTTLGQLEKSLKDENPNNVKASFTPITIVFTNGKQVKCGGIF